MGPATVYAWAPPAVWPKYLPWIGLLVLLSLPFNRKPAVLWIGVPLGCILAVDYALPILLKDLPEEAVAILLAAGRSLVFGFGSVWLLLPCLCGANRFTAFAKAWLALTVASLLSVSFSGIFDSGVAAGGAVTLMIAVVSPLFIGALALAGRSTRKNYSELRFLAWALFWVSVEICVLILPFAGIAAIANELPNWWPVLLGIAVIIAVSFGLLLPWILLCCFVPLYRSRFRDWLRVSSSPIPPHLASLDEARLVHEPGMTSV